MDSKEIIFLVIIYISSFTGFYLLGFKGFGEITWLKIIFSALTAIIITAILGFLFITIRRKTLKKELSHLVINLSKEKPKKIDKIFFLFSYLLIIPVLIFIGKYPFFIGVPLICSGTYGLLVGRMFILRPYGFILYETKLPSRIWGLTYLISGIGLSYWIGTTFPRF